MASDVGVSDEFIEAAVAAGDPMVLRVVLYQFTSDESLRDLRLGSTPGYLGPITVLDDEEDIAQIRKRMCTLLRELRDGRVEAPPLPRDRVELHHLMNMTLGTELPEEEIDFWLEELGLGPHPRNFEWRTKPNPSDLEQFRVIVIGAGFSGVNAAIQMKRVGVPFLLLDRSPAPGGTWARNTYPGIRVDIPSRFYSFSYEAAYPWLHEYAPQAELQQFMEYCVDKYDVRSHMRFDSEVLSAAWDDATQSWAVRARNGDGTEETHTANAIISAVGLLDRPKYPDLPGLDSFTGAVFHTAEWDHSYDLTDRRVAVIGTGASGMQLTPDLAPVVRQLTVFQRSPGWVFDVPGYRDPTTAEKRWLDSDVPHYVMWSKLKTAAAFSDHGIAAYDVDPNWRRPGSVSAANEALRERLTAYLMEKIGDRPDLLERCLPDYAPLAKRFIVDNGWFDSLKRDNVRLETTPIAEVTPRGIRLESGEELEFDLIVLATGFRANEFLHPMHIVGRDGLSLTDFWSADGPRAYLGMMMPKFPNLWCLYGPNTNPKTGGAVLWSELATRYILGLFEAMFDHGWSSVEIAQDVFDDHQRLIDASLKDVVWEAAGQRSYYTHPEFDRIAVQSPFGTFDYWRWTRTPDLNEFVTHTARR